MKLTDIILENKVASAIDQAITQIDPNLGYKEFAEGVAGVLREEYGTHLFKLFIEELSSNLGLQEEVQNNEKPKFTISYTEQGNRLYSIKVNGIKQYNEDLDKYLNIIKSITGIELRKGRQFDEDQVVDALKAKGYEAESFPMDIS